MKFIALIYGDETPGRARRTTSARGDRAIHGDHEGMRDGRRLRRRQPAHVDRDATSVRIRDAETLVVDGPYAEVKEALGGYYLLECDTMDEALDWAARIPAARTSGGRGPARLHRPGGGAAVKYALLIYGPTRAGPTSPTRKVEHRADVMPRWLELFDELRRVDPEVGGQELDERRTAKVVRVRDGERLVTDGPFAETKEYIGGLFVVDLPDLDEAIRLASLDPDRGDGAIEIRPLVVEEPPASGNGVEEAFREEWGRVVAILTRALGDLELAEDAVQDAFAAALERWPRTACRGTREHGSSRLPETARSTGSAETGVQREGGAARDESRHSRRKRTR